MSYEKDAKTRGIGLRNNVEGASGKPPLTDVANVNGLMTASGLGVITLINCASTTNGRNGVGVPVGVSDTSGVSVMVGVNVMVGDRVMVGTTEGVSVGATVGEGGK